MADPRHIAFAEVRTTTTGKTRVWEVHAILNRNDILGEVRWFGRWRCYGFFPAHGTLFERQCLRDICGVLRETDGNLEGR